MGLFFLLLGPSGVGKGTVMNMLKQHHPEFVYPRSVTTRPMRSGEKEGDMYYFILPEQFDRYIEQDKLLEWAWVHGTQRYGVLKAEVVAALNEGKTVLREVDVAGYHSILRTEVKDQVIAIFIMPTSLENLKERIVRRSPIDENELAARLDDVAREIEAGKSCDYHVVSHENHQKEVYEEIERIILEKIRESRSP